MPKKIIGIAITKIQKMLLRSQSEMALNLYYYLAKKHFKLILGKDLEIEILNNTTAGYQAAKRHSRLVLKVLYKDASPIDRKIARCGSKGSFVKNIILGADL